MEPISRRRMEIVFGLFLLTVFLIIFIISFSYPARPRELPMLIDGIAIVLVIIHLVKVIRIPADTKKISASINWQALYLAVASMGLYLILAYFIGMVLSSAVIVYGCGMAFGSKSKVKMAIVAALTVLVIYLLFVKLLGVPLYSGILFHG